MSLSIESHVWSHLTASEDSSHRQISHVDDNVISRDVNSCFLSTSDVTCCHDVECDDGDDDVMFDDLRAAIMDYLGELFRSNLALNRFVREAEIVYILVT